MGSIEDREADLLPGAWALDLKGSLSNKLASPVEDEAGWPIRGRSDHGLSDWEVVGCFLLPNTWWVLASL